MIKETPTSPPEEPKIQAASSSWSLTASEPPNSLRQRILLVIKDWTYTLLIGCLTVSHWRGLWTLLDLWFCKQPQDATGPNGDNFCFAATYAIKPEVDRLRVDSAVTSYILGAVFTFVGVALVWMGLWTPSNQKVTPWRGVVRFLIVYTLGFATVNQWRSIWYFTDSWVWKDRPVDSYWLTACVGSAGAFLLCSGASLLAPPAVFVIDGPSLTQPPIAVTIVSNYYSLTLPASETPPEQSIFALLVDAIVSFYGLPILVVWFWRGCWYLQDWYFWGFTDNVDELNMSLLWSTILGLICVIVCSEPVMYFIPDDKKKFECHGITTGIIGRLHTLILAIGAVSFWRVVWNLWDLGGTSNASAWVSETCSVFLLTAAGCVCCITAPPSTIGCDFTPNPKCHDEPLFSMLPIPWEILYFFGIGRQPKIEVPSGVELVEIPEMEGLAEPEPEAEVKVEVEAEEEEVPPPTPEPRPLLEKVKSWRPELERVRSWRPGIERVHSSYFDLQRPGLGDRVCSEGAMAQRPGLENFRHRSQYFRNR